MKQDKDLIKCLRNGINLSKPVSGFRVIETKANKSKNQKSLDKMKSQPIEKLKQKFMDEVFFPCEVVDGFFCFENKKPIYIEDTGGKRIVGYEVYPENECACGAKQRKINCWKWIEENILSSPIVSDKLNVREKE